MKVSDFGSSVSWTLMHVSAVGISVPSKMMNVSGLGISVWSKMMLFSSCFAFPLFGDSAFRIEAPTLGFSCGRDARTSDTTIRFGPVESRRPHRDWGPEKGEFTSYFHYLDRGVHMVIVVPGTKICDEYEFLRRLIIFRCRGGQVDSSWKWFGWGRPHGDVKQRRKRLHIGGSYLDVCCNTVYSFPR